MREDKLGEALQVVFNEIPVPGAATLCVTVTADDGTTGALMATWQPGLVQLMQAWRDGADISGLRPAERWVQTAEGYAQRLDGVEVTRWYGEPRAEWAALFPSLGDGNRQRRATLSAKSIEAACIEADNRWPLPAWWAEVQALNKPGGEG